APRAGGGEYANAKIASILAKGVDNDTAGVLIEPIGGETLVNESGAAINAYQVRLMRQPATDVWIAIGSDTGELAVTDPATHLAITQLHFDQNTWSTPQVVEISAPDDGATEGIHFSRITHSLDYSTNADPVAAAAENAANVASFLNLKQSDAVSGLAAQILADTTGNYDVTVDSTGTKLTVSRTALKGGGFTAGAVTLTGAALVVQTWTLRLVDPTSSITSPDVRSASYVWDGTEVLAAGQSALQYVAGKLKTRLETAARGPWEVFAD